VAPGLAPDPAFYVPPSPLPAAPAGTLLRSAPFDAVPGARGWRILYLSQTARGAPVAVSGVVFVPTAAAPAGGRPVLSWAHGTTGLGDDCAISVQMATGRSAERVLAPLLLGAGYAFVATDYEGLGTPGDHPYVVGPAEGRDVLDAVRAAAQLPETGIAPSSPVLVWGHSQGGGAAAWAGELQPTYAPELRLVGVAAGAPAAELRTLATSLASGRYRAYGLMTLSGLAVAFPEADPATVLNAKGLGVLATIRTECNDAIDRTVAAAGPSELGLPADVADRAPWAGLLDAVSPGQTRPAVPVFLYHGASDDLIPPAISAALAQRYCRLGATVERRVYPGDHTSVLLSAAGDLLRWLNARLAGTPPTSTC
jgi:pimeloyl-ACP methyl ester carboxylesterase